MSGPNCKGRFNNYPLHVAAVWGDCHAIDLLVSVGAVIDQQGEHGFTPLMEAVAQRHVSAIKKLIELGAKPVRSAEGMLPSEYAGISGSLELADFLREKGF